MSSSEEYVAQVAANVRAMAARKRVLSLQLAHHLRVSPMAMSRRMRGEVPLRVDELATVARVLGVSVHDLLPDESTPTIDLRDDAPGAAHPFPAPRPRTHPSRIPA